MIRQQQLHAWLLSVAVLTGSRALAESEFTALLNKIPPSANVLVTLNPEKIFASEVATAGGWKQQYESTFADSPLLLPPTAEQFVLTADLDLSNFSPRWQAAVMRLSTDPSMALLARSVHGKQDQVGGLESITTSRGAAIVKFGPHVFGLRQPGDRQVVGRWLQDAKSRAVPVLSPYLQSAANVPDRVGTEIIMAIDLTDALSPERVRQAMGKSKVLRDHSADVGAVSDLITRIQGLTLGARVTKRVYGKLKIDFDGDTKVLADVAKPLFLEVLDEAGASIDEFENWNVEISPRRITLSGELTQSGLRRLFSFLEIDGTAVNAADDKVAEKGDPTEPKVDAYASLRYFQSVTRYLNDLKREKGAKSYYAIAVWFDKYARRIDRLPILNVDKDLVDYGHRTVSQLRNCVEAIRGAGIRSGARSAQVTGPGYSDDGYYGSYPLFTSGANYAAEEVGAVEQERRAIRAQEQGQSSMDVRAIIRQLEEETSTIRRLMTERYNIEFTETVKPSS